MPQAHVAYVPQIKYAWLNHDIAIKTEDPPTLNAWVEALHVYDARLIEQIIVQTNDENDAKDMEIRWTVDGVVYLDDPSLVAATSYYVYKDMLTSDAGTAGLDVSQTECLANRLTDLRGQDILIEFRIKSVNGTNQKVITGIKYETLEPT